MRLFIWAGRLLYLLGRETGKPRLGRRVQQTDLPACGAPTVCLVGCSKGEGERRLPPAPAHARTPARALVGSMSGAKKHCLDNPSRPSKVFRDIIGKRRRQDTQKLRESLTPALMAAFEEFKSNGRKLGAPTERDHIQELATALENALDGELDLDNISCGSCNHHFREQERAKQCDVQGTVRFAGSNTRALPARTHARRLAALPLTAACADA